MNTISFFCILTFQLVELWFKSHTNCRNPSNSLKHLRIELLQLRCVINLTSMRDRRTISVPNASKNLYLNVKGRTRSTVVESRCQSNGWDKIVESLGLVKSQWLNNMGGCCQLHDRWTDNLIRRNPITTRNGEKIIICSLRLHTRGGISKIFGG